jgi:hypothetical protein
MGGLVTTATFGVLASINGGDFMSAEIRVEETVQYIRSETAVKPDPAWEHTDSNGHFHAFAGNGETPTLRGYSIHVDCDGSCGGTCGGEGYDETHWECVICGEEVKPRFIPDQDARTTGIPVVTSRSSEVVVHGTGAFPPLGQTGSGDGTFTFDARPAQVAVRVRTADGEMIGTGYASLSATYRRSGAEWTVTVHGASLAPRLGQPELEQAT